MIHSNGLYIYLGLLTLGEIVMALTLTNLEAAVAKLSTDVAALIAAPATQQAAVDALTTQVTTLDAQVVAATPVVTPPTP